MSIAATNLLASLKNFTQCNQDLTATVKCILLNPLQRNPNELDPLQQPPISLNGNDLNAKAKYLVPLALRIVNQNIDSLKQLKEWKRRGHSGSATNTNTIKQCLIDTSFYAISTLEHLERFSSLKPLDIEKTTSNLICKVVDLGEWGRALEELRKLRQKLASIANIQLNNTPAVDLVIGHTITTASNVVANQHTSADNIVIDNKNLNEHLPLNTPPDQQYNQTLHANTSAYRQSPAPEFDHCLSMVSSSEAEMIMNYGDLFTLPLDVNINDRSLILLVLACQMNVIRSWCEINNGVMVKYIGTSLNQSGNFIDWCKHLMSYDGVMAKKQLDLLQRHLTFTTNKIPEIGNPEQVMTIQFIALKASAYTDKISLQSLCNQILHSATTYEKNANQVKYDDLQKYCYDFLQILEPKSLDSSEDELYLAFCEYYVYISRKANVNSGVIQGLTSMNQLLDRSLEKSTSVEYFYAACSTHTKLSLCTAQMDEMTLNNSYTITLFTDTSSSLQSLTKNIETSTLESGVHIENVIAKVYSAIHGFIRSTNQLWDMVQQPRDNSSEPQLPGSRLHEISSVWKLHTNTMSNILQQCSTLLPIIVALVKKKGWTSCVSEMNSSPNDVVFAKVDILILLAKLQYDAANDDTYHLVYDYLATAEQICSDNVVSSGYRRISATYYAIGAGMITMNSISNTIYPLRKACALLEKDSERMKLDTGKIELVKRYEVLGTCYQKNGDFEGARKAYRLALDHLPITTIDSFTTGSDQMTISTMIQQQPFVPKLIEHFVRSAFYNHEQNISSTEIMDLSTLTPIQKCVIYEWELNVLFMVPVQSDLTKLQSWLIESLLRHYTADQYPIRRGRSLLYQVRILHANGLAEKRSIHAAVKHAQEAHVILSSKNHGLDMNLLTYRRHYLALSCSWIGILRHQLNETLPNTFVSALQQWGILFKKIKPLSSAHSTPKEHIEEIYQQVDNIDSLYDHLRHLADFFGLIGHFTLQINALRLLLKLNIGGLRKSEVDHVSDSIIVSTEIGHIYMDLGYSGMANLEFEKAKTVMEKYSCSIQAELHYWIQYSQYFSTIGDYDNSLVSFDTARTLWETSSELGTCKKSPWPMELQPNKYFILSDCYLARSALSLHKESLNSSIVDANWSYQILCNFQQSIKQHHQPDSTEHPFLTENINTDDHTMDPDQLSTTTSGLLFQKYQWATAMRMSRVLQRLARLHMARGTWNDAQHFLEQGKKLGERIKSNMMVYHFQLLLYDSYLRTDQMDKSRLSLKAANEIRSQGHIYLQEEVRWTIAIGHSNAKQNMLDDALESFNCADLLYRKMMDPTCIAALGNLSRRDEELEPNLINPSDTQHTEDIGCFSGATGFKCKSLQDALGENATYKALVMERKGMISTALDTLTEFEEPGAMVIRKDFLVAVGAHIRLQMVKNKVNNQANSMFLVNNVCGPLPLDLSLQASSQMIHSNKTVQNIQLVRDDITRILECMTTTHRQCAKTEDVEMVANLCRDIGFTLLLRNQTLAGDSNICNNNSTLTGYYLDMAKSIGLRREIQKCLDQKLITAQRRMVNGLDWPRRLGDLAYLDSPTEDDCNPRRSFSLLGGQTMAYFANLRDTYQQEHDLTDAEFQTQFIDILPPNWTVCSLSLDPTHQELYVARYCSGESPLVMKLPINRADERTRRLNTGQSYRGTTYVQAVDELENIIQLSDETIHSSKETLLMEDVENWWATRSKLDTRMKNLLGQIEQSWIGGFKGLFCGRRQVCEEAFIFFQQSMHHILLTHIYGLSATANKRIVNIDKRILDMILRLGTTPMDQDMEDIIYFIFAYYETHGICIDYSGTIVRRMTQQIRNAIQSYHDQSALADINTLERLPNDHIILIPDKFTEVFPWESLPTLRSQPVSRLPCISFLRDRILCGLQQPNCQEKHGENVVVDENQLNGKSGAWNDITVDSSLTYFLLNPSGDLKYTQAEFEKIFSRMQGWEGHVQTKPSEIECRSMLMQKDLYMYFGHGAGQSLIRGQIIRQLPRCPIALLMGCSSGRLQSHGEFDTDGYVINYLMAGSPAVVANLWDVTDKSIDQVSKGMMDRWGLFSKSTNQNENIRDKKYHSSTSLVEALSLSRDDCPLPYLTGAATVVRIFGKYLAELNFIGTVLALFLSLLFFIFKSCSQKSNSTSSVTEPPMDFSPYKPSPDENRTRQDGQQKKGKSKSALSHDPYKTSSSYSSKTPTQPSPYQVGGAGPMSSSLLEEGLFSDGPSLGVASGGPSSSATMRVNKYETTLPIRVDLEAALTYLFPPLSGLLFLVLETQNDYVRFHAWQSSALFLFLMSLQFIMIFISSFLSWVLFFVGIGSILYLAYHAYLDGASLERYEVPYFGPMASEWVDTE